MSTEIAGIPCERVLDVGKSDQIAWFCAWHDRMVVINTLLGSNNGFPHPHPDKPEMTCRAVAIEGKGPMQIRGDFVSFQHAQILATYSDKPLTVDPVIP